jgi:TolB protein
MKLFFLIFSLIINFHCLAQGPAEIAVGEAELDKDKFVIDDSEIKSDQGSHKAIALEMLDIIRNDFSFYKHKFNNINYADKGKNSYSSPQLEQWNNKGISYFVTSQVLPAGSGIEAKFKVWSILTNKEILSQTFKVDQQSIRHQSHVISDAIYRAITGKSSIFNSKIVFISDRTTAGKDIVKELYLMDFDGRRVERLTDFNSVVLSPSVAPDNSKIMYSVIAPHKEVTREKVRITKNIDLQLLDLKTKKITTISNRPGINSGGIFSTNPDVIYLTLSFSGNADIYEMQISTGRMRKVTSHYADDVDPSITKDGSLMSFLSNRAGRANIYTMDPSQTEKDVKRISFVGQFNATPRFSPDGKEIVFTSWVDNGFDLYRISSDGANLSRLTKDFGSNEEPVYSPDGEFIVFTSKRVLSKNKAVQDIYIMNRDGEVLGQLTQDFGRCFSPQWTN